MTYINFFDYTQIKLQQYTPISWRSIVLKNRLLDQIDCNKTFLHQVRFAACFYCTTNNLVSMRR